MLTNKADTYVTPDIRPGMLARLFTTLAFYLGAISIVFRASFKASRGRYDFDDWSRSSQEIADLTESVGGRITIEGLNNLRSVEGPCVVVANHMSTLETFLLPAIINPVKNITFVVKQSLVEYPVFKHVMRASKPITVTRLNPRDDLKMVFEEGMRMLSEGRSVVIFPQTTRSNKFDPSKFNTIGMKLAVKASVPVVPLALITNFWANGKLLKDYGRIHPRRTVRFCFGRPITIKGKGHAEHQDVVDFVQSKIEGWINEQG